MLLRIEPLHENRLSSVAHKEDEERNLGWRRDTKRYPHEKALREKEEQDLEMARQMSMQEHEQRVS